MNTTATAAVVEIRPGEGGDDAHLFARQLGDAICAHLRRTNSTARRHDSDRTLTLELDRPDATVGSLAGVHRIQRIPVNETRGRRHTSTVTVAVLNPADTRTDADIDLADLDVSWFSGTGAGGQHRNKTQNCCRIRHTATGIVVVGTAHRSRDRNFDDAVGELRRRLNDDQQAAAAGQLNAQRASQVDTGSVERGWLWNDQRDQVTNLTSGARGSMRKALAGRFPTTR